MARRIALLFGIVVLIGLTAASAEEIHLTKGRVLKKTDIIAESPKGITVKGGDKYPEADIEAVFFDKIEGIASLAYGAAFKSERTFLDTSKSAKERAAAYADAKVRYDKLVGELGDKRAKAHLEFTIGYLMGLKSLEDGSPPQNAIVRLNEYVKSNPQSWQVVRSLRLLARLQQGAKDLPSAKQTLTQLAKLDVPDDLKQDALLQIAMIDVNLGQHAAALPQLTKLLETMPKDSPVYARTQLAQAECFLAGNKPDEAMTILKKTLKEAKDESLKGVAHNALGVTYFNEGKFKEARWEFLWVDVKYNQDKAEHARALYYLTQTLEKLGEAARADECRDQLLNDGRFAGTEFQRKLQKERGK